MIADSVAFLAGRGQARALRRRALLRRLARRPRLRAGLPARGRRGGRRARRALRHQRLLAARRRSRAAVADVVAALRRRRASASTATTTAGCGVANTLAAVEAGATQVQGTMNGIGERTGNANLVTIIANLQLKMGHEVRHAERLAPADRDRALRRRAAQPQPRPAPALRRAATPSRTRAACTSPACAPTRRRSSTSTRRWSATTASCCVSELAGQRHGRREGRRRRHRRSTTRLPRACVERVKALEHAGYQFEAADAQLRAAAAQGGRRLRAAVPAGVLARDRRAARRRQGRDRGDDQDLGRRRALRAHRRGQRPGQRARPARCARRSARSTRTSRTSSSSTSRSASSTRRTGTDAVTRVRSTPPTATRRGARSASARTSSPRRGRRSSTRWSSACSRAAGRRPTAAQPARHVIPLAKPVLGEREERAGARGPALGAALARPARAARSSRRFAARLGAAHASAVSSGTAGLHLALRAAGVERGRRGRHVAVLVRGQRQRGALRARAPGVRRHRPGDAQPRPGRGARPRSPSARRRCCRCTSSATRPTCRPSRRSACRSSRTPARRSAPSTPTARAVGARGHPAVFGFYANKQLTTGEGGMVTLADAAVKERIDSERNQGRAPDMDWLDHDRLGFNYRLSDVACAIGLAQLERLDEHARRPRRAWPAAYREALAGDRGPRPAVRGRRRRPARLVRLRRPAPARARPRRGHPRACASAACSPSPTCRRST